MSVIVDGKVKLTYRELEQFPDDGKRHEIIDGEHYVSASPSTYHQTVSRRLQFELYQQLELTGLAQVFDAPTDVELSEIDILVPDIFVVDEVRRQIISPSRIIGSPDLVIEILSPSTSKRDLELKRQVYEKRQVPAYWIVDPNAQRIAVFDLTEGRYVERGSFHDQIDYAVGGNRGTVDLGRVW